MKTNILKKPTAANPHLNISRRRILNDYLAPGGNATIDGLINRNKSPVLMGQKGANVMTNGRDDFYNSLPYERINASGVSATPYVNMSSIDKD